MAASGIGTVDAGSQLRRQTTLLSGARSLRATFVEIVRRSGN
jgi:hypothetical protein